jgi:HemX protein
VLYGGALAIYWWLLYTNERKLGILATALMAAGVATHYFALLERSQILHGVPYQDLAGSMSLFAWLLGLTYLSLELIHSQRSVGALLLPFVLVFFLVSATLQGRTAPAPARGPLFALHVTINALAYSAFAISFVLSSIYLIQNRVLRQRQPNSIFWRFPPLETLERMSRSAVWVGVCASVVGTSLGFYWSHVLQGHAFTTDAKEIVALLILAAYAAYLWLGRTTAWRGSRAAGLCAVNFLLVVFSFTIVNLYLTKFHRYF